MASGLAVIAYDYAAARMHIVHRETGMLALYGDWQEFIEFATQLTRAPLLRQRIQQQARRYATSVSWDQVIDKFATLLLTAQAQSLRSARFPVRYRKAAA
jgi:glycosyltransferase involved in cell wall biosynthesis